MIKRRMLPGLLALAALPFTNMKANANTMALYTHLWNSPTMRISTDPKNKIGFGTWLAVRNHDIKVYVDEVLVEHVREADEAAGYVWRAKTDADGELYVENNEIVEERLTGNVKIEVGNAYRPYPRLHS